MGEDVVDDFLVFDTGDDSHCPCTPRTGLDIGAEHALKTLGRCHRRAPLGRVWLVGCTMAASTALARGYPRTKIFVP